MGDINTIEIDALNGKVVVLTGCTSGIGYATVHHLVEKGAHVIAGDIKEPSEPFTSDRVRFLRTDVCDWDQLKGLFKEAVKLHGRVDHVFANAGISSTKTYLEDYDDDELDEDGDPKQPPDHKVLMIDLVAVMDTVKLGLHYLKKNPEGGSIVLTASCSAFQRFSLPEYTAAKHGVLGLMRSLHNQLLPSSPSSPSSSSSPRIRINSISPSWTITGLLPRELGEAATGLPIQEASDVARSVGLLMADERRHGQLIYTCRGEMTEIEGELMDAAEEIVGRTKGTYEGDGTLDGQAGKVVGALGVLRGERG